MHAWNTRSEGLPTLAVETIPSIIPIYIQQDATLQSLFYLETALHVSGNTITHHQERKQLYLQFFSILLCGI